MTRKNKGQEELEEFRSLMEVPSTFEEGFSFSSLLGALFLSIVMIPGCLYMELIAGEGIGPAAQWVTVILFIEIAKRANAKLSRAQLFVLFYIAGIIVGQRVHGTPLFRQFLVKSESAMSFGITPLVPTWAAPMDMDAYDNRSFFQVAWLPAIALMCFTMFFGRLNAAILGYGLFRRVSDIEKLPFPLAPVGAQGIVALAEEVEGVDAVDENRSSRWRVFCIGGAIGLVFGLIYMALPTLSGALLGQTLAVFPIPFVDWSTYTEGIMPAVATGLSFNLGQFIMGMVMPYYAMLGSFIGYISQFIANPILYHFEILHLWEPGDKTVETLFKNGIDLYFSLGIGLSIAVAVVGLTSVFTSLKAKHDGVKSKANPVPEGRGDIPNMWILIVYLISTSIYVIASGWLVDWHFGVMVVLVFFGVLYTPLISYVTSRLEGLAGQVIEIPFIREISFIMSGYQGVAIWFIPIPKANYGRQTVFYKQAELLGTKFTSLWKANLLLFPIIIIGTVCFSSFIWSLAPIPSDIYPYTQEIWELQAKNTCLLYSSTLGEYSPFEQALSFTKVCVGFGLGMGIYGVLAAFNAPVLIFYGFVRGLGNTLPHVVLTQFAGACLGRYYFQKKYGKNWRKHIPVISAGFLVGMGLISMFCIGIVFLCKATSSLPY